LRSWLELNVDREWRSKYRTDAERADFYKIWERQLFKGGWSAIWWPKEFGGRSSSAVENAIYAHEIARIDAPDEFNKVGTRLVGPLLMAHGSAAQKAHLRGILEGTEIWCQGFSEPDAGSDLANLRTRAEPAVDGWLVDGLKCWTSFARYADYCLLLARTGSQPSRQLGISVFIVDMRLPGINVQPIRQIHGRGDFNNVTFDHVRLGPEALLGEVNQGWAMGSSVLSLERGTEFCLARFRDSRRHLEGLIESVANRPHLAGLADRIGYLYGKVFATQLGAFELLGLEQAGSVPPGFASMAKLYASETWRELGRESVELLGTAEWQSRGEQLVEDYFQSQHYTIAAGTSEIQRNTIARTMLELPSSKRAGS